MSEPFVSLVVPARNASRTINKCIDSLLRIDYPNYEIICINDASIDATAAKLSKYSNIKIIATSAVGPSEARNMGVAKSFGDFLLFIDADCVADAQLIRELLRGFSGTDIAGVGGSQMSPADDTAFGKKVNDFLSAFGFISEYMKSSDRLVLTKHNPSCNVMYRRNAFLEVSGFCPRLWPNEDVELDYKLRKKGYKLLFNPQAIVYHYRVQSLSGFIKMIFRYGYSGGLLMRRYGIFRRVHLVPFIFFSLILLSAINLSISAIVLFVGISAIFVIAIARSRHPLSAALLGCLALVAWNIGCALGVFRRIKAA